MPICNALSRQAQYWIQLDTIELGTPMNLTLLLTEIEEAKLRARAESEGMTPEEVVREAIQPIIASVPEVMSAVRKPKKSLLGILAKYGPAPTEADLTGQSLPIFRAG